MIIGDKVSYHGSLEQYYEFEFTISDLFEYNGVECATLRGPKMGIWIARCRVSNLKIIGE